MIYFYRALCQSRCPSYACCLVVVKGLGSVIPHLDFRQVSVSVV